MDKKVALFVLLFALVGMGSVHAEPYEDVLKEVRIMQSRISNLEKLVLSQQKEIERLRGEQEESASGETMSTGAGQSTVPDVVTNSRHEETRGLQGEREESSSVQAASLMSLDSTFRWGRFDLPYGVDYQHFASVDRPNVSAPITTERIQLGGYNSDGIRCMEQGVYLITPYMLSIHCMGITEAP